MPIGLTVVLKDTIYSVCANFASCFKHRLIEKA